MDLDEAQRKRIERGEILTSLAEVDGHKRARAVALIEAPVAKVWEAITDYDRYQDFMPHTKESRVLERKKNQVLFHTVLEFPIRDVWYDILLTLDPKRHHVDWTLKDGSIKANDGSWDLKKHDKTRVLATYTLAIDPGFFLPKFLLQKATQGTLPLVFQAVRKRVGAGG